MRHIARKGRCYVIGVNPCVSAEQIPANFPDRERVCQRDPGDPDWVEPGNTVIVSPSGEILAGPATTIRPNMTVHQKPGWAGDAVRLLREAAAAHPDRDAYVEDGARLSFAGWDRAADGVASGLAERGVGRGSVVALLVPSSIDYAVCYQAAMRLGAITSGINPRLGPNEIASIVERTRPAVLVVDGAAPAPAPDVLAATVVVRRDEVAVWRELDPLRRLPSLDPTDAVAIVWTSGTTGTPKGAVFDHRRLRAMATAAGALSAPGDRRLSPLPFAHVGYMTRPWDEIERGITTIITPTPWRAGDAIRLMHDERVTVAQGVPAQWSLMLAHPDLDTAELSSLRLAATGAAPAAPELIRELRERLGCPVVVRYASTEASVITGSRPGDPDHVVARTVGRAGAGVEVAVTAEDGRPLPVGQVGTVRVRSAAVMREYWRDEEATKAVLAPDGWLATGDLGRLDADGNLTLAGRRSELYIRGGYNVYPSEVEAALSGHPRVREVAVVGIDDPVLGEIGVAVVVPAMPGKAPVLDDLRAWCRERLADYKAPDRLVVVDELPLTPMSKIDKGALRALVLQEAR